MWSGFEREREAQQTHKAKLCDAWGGHIAHLLENCLLCYCQNGAPTSILLWSVGPHNPIIWNIMKQYETYVFCAPMPRHQSDRHSWIDSAWTNAKNKLCDQLQVGFYVSRLRKGSRISQEMVMLNFLFCNRIQCAGQCVWHCRPVGCWWNNWDSGRPTLALCIALRNHYVATIWTNLLLFFSLSLSLSPSVHFCLRQGQYII